MQHVVESQRSRWSYWKKDFFQDIVVLCSINFPEKLNCES